MRLPVIVSCVLLAAVTPALSDEPINFPRIAAQLSRAQLMESVGALAGFDGRQSGTPGGEAAAAYIVRRLPKAMLQSFPVNTVTIDAPVQVEILDARQDRLSAFDLAEHPLVEIDGGDAVPQPDQRMGDATGAAPEVEDRRPLGSFAMDELGLVSGLEDPVQLEWRAWIAHRRSSVGEAQQTG